ncbi:filamentous hemagglutinin N-terminal domain-containing protein, partial [Mitsuokella jalaludinii]
PVMTIEQTKGQSKAFINWETFSIGKDAAVHVKQYSGADLLVNAVRGNKMSEIAGKLNATGNVALINPNGVIFMNGAQVNVGGLGVYATSYSVDDKANVSILNSGKEGSIEIQSGAAINAGVSAALANLSALNIAPKDYAIAIDSDGESGYTNAARSTSAPTAMPTTTAASSSRTARTARRLCRVLTASASTPMQRRSMAITIRPMVSMLPRAVQKKALMIRQRTIRSMTTRTSPPLTSTARPIPTAPVCP